MSLSQRNYCLQILEDTSFLGARLAIFCVDPNLKVAKSAGNPHSHKEATVYHPLLGRLLYLHISHSDVSFSVHKFISQFLQQPCSGHLDAVHHLLRYLKGSLG